MRTTLNLETGLLEELMALSDVKSKSNAVNEAIAEYVRRRKLQRLKSLSGQVELDQNWTALRQMELNEA